MNLRSYLLSILLISISLSGAAQQQTDLLLRAEQSLSQGDTIAAIDYFQQVLIMYPQSFAASMRLSEVYYDQQDYQTAVQYCNIALDITDNFRNSVLERLNSPNISKEEQEKGLRKIEHYRSDHADILHLKGLIRSRQSRRKDAIEAFKKALEIKVDAEILSDLALTYLETGYLYDALHLLHQSKALEPENYKPYYNLANVHYKVDDLDSAIHYYRITQKKAPKLKWPYLYSGLIYTKKGEYQKAIDEYSAFLALDPDSEEAYFRRAVLWSELREWEKALQDWDQVVRFQPKNVEAWRNKGLSHFQAAEYDSAIRAFDKALELDSNEAYSHINRGYSYYLTDKPKKALADLNKGLEGLQKYYLGYYFRALVYLQMRKKKKACSDLKMAVKLGMKESEVDERLSKKCF